MAGRSGEWLRANPGALLAAAALACVAGWFAVFPVDASVTSDDGAYAIQVISLEETGRWSVPHVVAEQDPEGEAYPFVNTSVTERGFFPGGRHASWVSALRPGYAVLGEAGMRVLPAVGFAVAVGVATALGTRLHGRSGGTVAGLLTLASPLLFQALQLWAHALVAGAIAVATWAAVRLLDDGVSVRLVLVAAAGVAVASGLRADGLVFAAAIVAVVGISGLRARHAGRILAAAATGVAAVGAYLAMALHAASILGSSDAVGATSGRSAASDVVDFVTGRVAGAFHTFLSASDGDPVPVVLAIAAAGLVLGAVLALRRCDHREGAILLGAAAALWAVRLVVYPDAMASGLVGAWPVAVLVVLRPYRDLSPSEKRLAGMLALAAVGVALTQYDEGGGVNWGGRFLSAAIPALAVLVAGAVVRFDGSPAAPRLRVATAALAVLALAGGLAFDGSLRSTHDDYVERASGLDDEPVVTSIDALPRLAWRLHPDTQWLKVPEDDEGARRPERLLRMLQAEGIERIVLYGVGGPEASVLTGGEVQETVDDPRVVRVGGR